MSKVILSLIAVTLFSSIEVLAGLLPSPKTQCYWSCEAQGGTHQECKRKCGFASANSYFYFKQNTIQETCIEFPIDYSNTEGNNFVTNDELDCLNPNVYYIHI